MESKHKRIVMTIILAALILVPSITIAIFYCDEGTEPEEYQKKKLNLVPGVWTPELVKAYNDSDSIEKLEYVPLEGIVINNKCVAVNKLVIVAIPDWMENRGSFGTYMYIESRNNKNVLIGNSTVLLEKELHVAYIFTDVNVSESLYDRYIIFNHPALRIEMSEIIGIDLTGESLDGTVM